MNITDTLIENQKLIALIEKLQKEQAHADKGAYRVEKDNIYAEGHYLVLWRPSAQEASSHGREVFKGPHDTCNSICLELNAAAQRVTTFNLILAEDKLRKLLTAALLGDIT